jgi:hypothetical protein
MLVQIPAARRALDSKARDFFLALRATADHSLSRQQVPTWKAMVWEPIDSSNSTAACAFYRINNYLFAGNRGQSKPYDRLLGDKFSKFRPASRTFCGLPG